MRDLVILVADGNMELAVRGILSRPQALGIREVTFDVIPYVGKNDPGCYHNSHNFLRPYIKKYNYALVLFDHVGCGQERQHVSTIENVVKGHLFRSGWTDRTEVVVIEPELETWIWSDSPEVARCLGWQGENIDLKTFLFSQNLWRQTERKPSDPKKAVEKVLRKMRRPRSASIYHEVATKVSFQRCEDSAFKRLRNILTTWFAASSS